MTARERATLVVEELFTNGFGDKAQRLVLEMEDGRDGGGLSRAPIIDRIEAALLAHVKALP